MKAVIPLFLILTFSLIRCSDQPTKLSNKPEIIEVSYVNWACNCADFIETTFYKSNPNYEIKEEDCIFIEAADSSIEVPISFYTEGHFEKNLRLTGQFYLDKGVPNTYEFATPGTADKARVFHYTKIEIIDK